MLLCNVKIKSNVFQTQKPHAKTVERVEHLLGIQHKQNCVSEKAS